MGRKQIGGYFKREISEISKEKNWIRISLMKETEFLLIEAQFNAIRTNYVKAIID